MVEIGIQFEEVAGERLRDVVAFVGALAHLCRGTLQDCDLAVGRSSATCLLVARFAEPPPEAVRERLAFWASWAGGFVAAGGAFPPPAGALHRRVGARALRRSADHLLRALEIRAPGGEVGRLVLRVAAGTPEAAGLSYDQRREALFVPSVRLPPPGEPVAFRVRLPGGVELEGAGTVASIRAAGEEGPGSPPGFLLGLANPSVELLRALEAHAGPGAQASGRRAPRYSVRARATVRRLADASAADGSAVARLAYASAEDLAEDWVENLSQGGAFVRTRERLPVGSRIRLALELPGGAVVEAPATVVHGNDRGVGVRFTLDAVGETQLAEAVAQLVARRRRALVVDDDLLARRMLGDALASRGFEVIAAGDGASGLRVLSEELLDLDLLVTDLRMPYFDGERLLRVIREAGGERDLAILVVTSGVDGGLERRLLEAGADAVVEKGGDLSRLGEVARTVVLRRRVQPPGAPVRAA